MLETNHRQSLIQAIADLDIEAVEKFMDDDVAHFQGEKSIVIGHLADFFNWMSDEKGESTIEDREIKCSLCYHDDGTKVTHKHVVSFCFSNGGFAFDIEPTKNGLFKLDICEIPEYQSNKDFSNFTMRIYSDQVISFKPDSRYFRLLEEKEKMLADIDNEQIVFWFLDDFCAWLKKYNWPRTNIKENGFGMFAFNKLFQILSIMDSLYPALNNEDKLKLANEKLDKLNHSDVWKIYEWIEKYRFEEYSFSSSCDLNLNHVNEGYFTLKDFLPNLRFSVNGHSEFFKFIKNCEFAYGVTEEIRKDTLLEEIEYEWHWEEWEKEAFDKSNSTEDDLPL